jgi:hypothetical protein
MRARAQNHLPDMGRDIYHLVGGFEQRRRHFDAQLLGRLQVDDKIELGGSLNREVRRLLAPEDAIDVTGGSPEGIRRVEVRSSKCKID